jgi:lipopolysaccharide/colanic/teichoic acid biosynthesis glycosyltransferase
MLIPPGIPLTKRIFYLVLTLFGIIFLSPFLVIIAGLVWFYHDRPILFRQRRGGYRGRVFEIYKFRSMTEALDAHGNPLPDTQRLTRFGRFLRSTSLDELPEMLNVLRGEMSWVGPRPLFAHYLERYTPEQARRHEVLPGITGWAQVNGRNSLTWEDKFKLDVWYVDHTHIWLDIRIIFMTIIKIFQREGINQPGHATAEEFDPEREDDEAIV